MNTSTQGTVTAPTTSTVTAAPFTPDFKNTTAQSIADGVRTVWNNIEGNDTPGATGILNNFLTALSVLTSLAPALLPVVETVVGNIQENKSNVNLNTIVALNTFVTSLYSIGFTTTPGGSK